MAYLTIRNLPDPLHAALTKLAASNRRSINAEVVIAIEDRVASLTVWNVGDEAITRNDRERVTLLSVKAREFYPWGAVWHVRLSNPTSGPDHVPFPVDNNNLLPVEKPTKRARADRADLNTTIKRLRKERSGQTTGRAKSNDRCGRCGHMRLWHHGQYTPVTDGRQGRGAECSKCCGLARAHDFRFEATKRVKVRK